MKERDRVVIGFLSPGYVDPMFAISLVRIYKERSGVHNARRVGTVFDIATDENSGLLSRGRNQLAFRFMQAYDAEWMLMLDSDQQLTVEGFDKLCAAAHDTERPIVAGLYFGAWGGDFYPTPVPLIFLEHPERPGRFTPIQGYPRDQVIPVDSAGTGCLLVHRSVFEKIAAEAGPHEMAHFDDGTSAARWCWFRDMPVNGDWFSEDHFFCARAREVGFQLHAHTGVMLPHRKRFWLEEKHHLALHPDMLTPEELREPRWAGFAQHLETEQPETTEAEPAPERAVKPRPIKRKPVRR